VAEDVTLLINGKQHFGWEDVSIKRSMKSLSGGFTLSVTSKWAQEQKPFLINPGDECKLLLGSDQVIMGYVDETNPKYDSNSRSFGVSGRDKVGDMVDCSPDISTVSNLTIGEMAVKLAKPFGIGVTDTLKNTARKTLAINPGESCFEALDKMAKLRGCLLTNDGNGNIVITQAGKIKSFTELVEGVNILEADARYDAKQRFSKIKVLAQTGGLDGAGADPLADFVPKAIALDPGVTRYRPLVLNADGAADLKACQARAKWEVAVRFGRSTVVNVVTNGWRQGNGKLWTINELVRLRSPYLGLDIDLLLAETTFTKSNSTGTRTQMQLVPATAFSPNPTDKDPWRNLVLQESKR